MSVRATEPGPGWRRLVARRAAVLVLAAGPLLVPAGRAAPPIEPLPAPFYSFDAQSPSSDTGDFAPSDVLALGLPAPSAAVPGPALGLVSPLDDLDGLSGPNDYILPGQTFALLFSVDRQTIGGPPPDPLLVSLGVPYNVADQAMRGHAAGDQFASLVLYSAGGRWAPRGLRQANNSLVRNNYDEGGTDFSAQPPTSAQDMAPGAPQDDVDATAGLPTAAKLRRVVRLYFSLTADSPSLSALPGGQLPSGANIFFNADPLHPMDPTPTLLYAHAYELGLVPADDIDGLIVFDLNGNGMYDPPDRVLFSLTRASPSLRTIPGASPEGAAADVFFAAFGQPPALFTPAQELGLGDPQGNIDALDLVPCPDGLNCALLHGIRGTRGDLNCDNKVTFADIDPFVLALSGSSGYYAQYPFCQWFNADCNGDGQVNFADIDPFVAILSSGGTE